MTTASPSAIGSEVAPSRACQSAPSQNTRPWSPCQRRTSPMCPSSVFAPPGGRARARVSCRESANTPAPAPTARPAATPDSLPLRCAGGRAAGKWALVDAVALDDLRRQGLHRLVDRVVRLERPAGLRVYDAPPKHRVPDLPVEAGGDARVLELRLHAESEDPDRVELSARLQRAHPAEGEQPAV